MHMRPAVQDRACEERVGRGERVSMDRGDSTEVVCGSHRPVACPAGVLGRGTAGEPWTGSSLALETEGLGLISSSLTTGYVISGKIVNHSETQFFSAIK